MASSDSDIDVGGGTWVGSPVGRGRRDHVKDYEPLVKDMNAVRELALRDYISAADIRGVFRRDGGIQDRSRFSFDEIMVLFEKCCRALEPMTWQFETLDLISVLSSDEAPAWNEVPAYKPAYKSNTYLHDAGLKALIGILSLERGQSKFQDLRISIQMDRLSPNIMQRFLRLLQSGRFTSVRTHLHFNLGIAGSAVTEGGSDPGSTFDTMQTWCKELAFKTAQVITFVLTSSVRNYRFGYKIVQACAEGIALQVFRMTGLGLTDEGFQGLAQMLRTGRLRNLQWLDLSYNNATDAGIKALAESLQSGCGSNLQTLGLSGNWFEELEEGIISLAKALELGKCPKLLHLYLHGNRIRKDGLAALAKAFKSGHMESMKIVTLYHVNVEALSRDSIRGFLDVLEDGALAQLTDMWLFQEFSITNEPGMDDGMADLVEQFYRRNPYAIVQFRKWKTGWRIAGRNQREIWDEIENLWQSNIERVERRKVLQGEEVPGRHGKLFFCGDPRVGKTSLRVTLTTDNPNESWRARMKDKMKRSLICQSRQPEEPEKPNEQEPTRGIEVTHLETREDEATIALWDLAGQHEYEVLHSAFLPDSKFADGQATFFVIVCDARDPLKGKNELSYWMRFISSNSVKDVKVNRKRRVFVVLNTFRGLRDSVPVANDDRALWQHFLQQCKIIFEDYLELREEPLVVDVKTRSEVAEFKSELLKEAKTLLASRKMFRICQIVQEACRDWVQRERKRRSPPCPVLKWNAFKKFMGRYPYGITAEEKLVAAAEYLHEAGHIIVLGSMSPSRSRSSEYVEEIPLLRVGLLGGSWSLDKSGAAQSSQFKEGLVVIDPEWFCKQVIGNLLLPKSILRKGEVLNLDVIQDESGAYLAIAALHKTLFQVRKSRLEEMVMILSSIGICYRLRDHREKLFVPALIQSTDIPEWSKECWKGTKDKRAWVLGFSLRVRNYSSTLLPIAVLRKLQVDLALDESIGQQPDSGFSAQRFSISFKFQHMHVLIEYSSDKQERIDILVRPGGRPWFRGEQANVAQVFVSRVNSVASECAQGVELVKRVVQPWSAAAGLKPLLGRDVNVSATRLVERVKKEGKIDAMGWEVEGAEVGVEDVLSRDDLLMLYQSIRTNEELTKEAVQYLGDSSKGPDEDEHTLAASKSFSSIFRTEGLGEDNAKVVEILLRYLETRVVQPIAAGIATVQELQQRTLAEMAEMKMQIGDILDKQRTWNVHIQNLERFLVGEKDSSIPRFVYVTKKGLKSWWMKLNERVIDKLVIRFLCERYWKTGAFHEVMNQDGVDVKRMQDWAKKLLPWVAWTLKVAFVATKIAGNAALPGLGMLLGSDSDVSNIFPNLSALSGGAAELTKNLFEALDAYALQQSQFEESGVKVEEASSSTNTSRLSTHRWTQLKGDAKDAVRQILYNLKDDERRQQVGLRRVWLKDMSDGEKHVVWICNECFDKHQSLRPGSVHDLPIGQ